MATMGEFGSLLQLGFGIGAGLSVFRAPILRRANRLMRQIDRDLAAIRGVPSRIADDKISQLNLLAVRLTIKRQKLEIFEKPFLMLALLGSVTNLILLIKASTSAQTVISEIFQNMIIFISSFYYFIIVVLLEFMSWCSLDSIATKYKQIDQL
ncbi:hypothetical protein [Methylobacterium sp. WL9]|uniref:hypothetical protein n=1 Tax=Methylobacterium sp. WL9 TaxID=2603898 RepID=UPI0011CCDF0A|nr:hypothetical protein [Methylobacterium sp. WL9]TXN22170.1 hypothetical protein FV217_11900 [Methylobacterium sp. WL9]